jgi:hypothetical protein
VPSNQALEQSVTGSSEYGRQGTGFGRDGLAQSRAAVDAFHKAALDAGGADNGEPGLRPHYGEHYYAAFVIDPDGHVVEAVCRT